MSTLAALTLLRPADLARESNTEEVTMFILFGVIALAGVAALVIATFVTGRRMEAQSAEQARTKAAEGEHEGSGDGGGEGGVGDDV